MGGDGGVDEIASQPPDTRQRAVLVNAGEPAVADNIRDQYRREFPGLAHGANAEVARSPSRGGLGMAALPCPPQAQHGKRNHAQATATRRSGDLGISAVSETRKLAAILVADIVRYSRLWGSRQGRMQ